MLLKDLEILGGDKELKHQILLAIADSLNSRLPSVSNNIQQRISIVLKEPFKRSSVYNAIINGPLNAHFGIPRGEERSRIDRIIDILASQIKVQYIPIRVSSSGFDGGLYEVYAIEDDFEKISADESGITTNIPGSKQFRGLKLPWMKWLLFEGGKIIIQEHDVLLGTFAPTKSRSQEAIMQRSKSKFWSVPTAFQGTQTANFITESMENAKEWLESECAKIFKEELIKVL